MQCTDHIVKLAGGFFITAKRLLGTTCLAGGFRFIQQQRRPKGAPLKGESFFTVAVLPQQLQPVAEP